MKNRKISLAELADRYKQQENLDPFCTSVDLHHKRSDQELPLEEYYFEAKYICPECVFHESTCKKNSFFKVTFYKENFGLEENSKSMTLHVNKQELQMGLCMDKKQYFKIKKESVTKIQMERLLKFYDHDSSKVETALFNIRCEDRKLRACPI